MPYQTFDEMADAEPLVRFSFYLAGRVQVLLGMQSEILDHLNNLSVDGPIDFDRVATAERLSWLWILGAYEVVRTMCQAKHVCLSDAAARSIQKLKRTLLAPAYLRQKWNSRCHRGRRQRLSRPAAPHAALI
jgi:hypothetical protein